MRRIWLKSFMRTIPQSRVSYGWLAPPDLSGPLPLLGGTLDLLGYLPWWLAWRPRPRIWLNIVWKSQSEFRSPRDRDTEGQKSSHCDSLHITVGRLTKTFQKLCWKIFCVSVSKGSYFTNNSLANFYWSMFVLKLTAVSAWRQSAVKVDEIDQTFNQSFVIKQVKPCLGPRPRPIPSQWQYCTAVIMSLLNAI